MEADFQIEFEDDSEVTEVSKFIQDVYRRCAAGDLDGAREVVIHLDRHPAMRPLAGGGGECGDSGSDDEDGEEGEGGAGVAGSGASSNKPKHVVDEDGWETIVKPKKGKGCASVAASEPTRSTDTATAALAAVTLEDDAGKKATDASTEETKPKPE